MKVEEARAEYAALIKTDTLPGDRQWKTMGDIAEVVGGGTPRTSDLSNFEGGDIPWLTPADLSGYTEKYVSHGARFITRKGLGSSSARILPAGSVLFTSRAPIGCCYCSKSNRYESGFQELRSERRHSSRACLLVAQRRKVGR